MPGYANPQNLNRYSYVGNSPLNYTDPTGHKRVQDGPQQDRFSQYVADQYEPLSDNNDEEDDDDPGRSGRTRRGQPEPPSGSIFTSLYVLPSNAIHDAKLSTAAEESYTGWGGSGEMPYTFTAGFGNYVFDITGIASDFHNSSDIHPINIRIDWHGNDSGLSLDNIHINNQSPTGVILDGVQVSTGLSARVKSGPRKIVGPNGQIDMSVRTTIPMNQNIVLTVQVTTTGFPPNPYVHIGIPAGTYPPGGCTIPVRVR